MSASSPSVVPNAAAPAVLPAVEVLAPGALALVERVGGPRLLRELASLYASYAPARIAEARAAAAGGDADGLRRACHALKSGGAQLGATRLAAACSALEHRDAVDGAPDAAARLDEIAVLLAEALHALDAHVRAAAAE